jgi:hypothetical protein
MGEFALGQPVPRFEESRLIRGGGRYVDDMVLPRGLIPLSQGDLNMVFWRG